MIKAVLESIEGIAEHLKPEYKKGDDGKFYLEVEGIDDHVSVGELRRAKEREKTARVKAEEAAKTARAEREARDLEVAELLKKTVPADNIAHLEKSWGERLKTAQTEAQAKLDAAEGALKKVLVDSVVTQIATTLAKTPAHVPILEPHIRARVAYETVDGRATTRILDADGKPSAATVDDLMKEIAGKQGFGDIVSISKASGGGAQGGSEAGGAPRKPKLDDSPATWAAWAARPGAK
jgi:hypothetical protein